MDIRVVFTFLFTLMVSTFGDVYGDSVPTDVVFVVDGSSTTGVIQFIHEKKLIASIINKLDIAKTGTNAGIVVYGSNIVNTASLSPFKSESMLSFVTSRLSKMNNGGRNTAIGIKKAAEMFQASNRVPVNKFMIVIMGGSSDNPSLTAQQANNAKEQGITIIGIGFGSSQPQKFEREILEIASFPETVFVGNSYRDLNKFATPIAEFINPAVQEADLCKTNSLQCPPLRRLTPVSISRAFMGGCNLVTYRCVFDSSSVTVVNH